MKITFKMTRSLKWVCSTLAVVGLAFANVPASAEDEEAEQHVEAITKLVVDKGIPITYDYVAMLMRLPNAFGEGAACVVCHNSSDPAKSYRGMDLSTCEGIKKGATEAPARAIITPGKHKGGTLRRYLRDNRMPLGVAFDYPGDTENHMAVKKWIADGAKNDNFFGQKVLPLFAQKGAFGSEESCVDCHMSNQEPPSFHELDMTSHKGIMLGADAIAKAAEGKPPVKIVIPGKPDKSKLWLRLVENRMPAGVDPSEDRDHPNMHLMYAWIDQGAKCD